ncbi:pseudouridylate synthase, partial [Streptomyces sp. NPDC002130]
MRRKTRTPPSPLPQRRGVDPVRVRLPGTGTWETVREHLVERLSGAGAGVVDGMFDCCLVPPSHCRSPPGTAPPV